MDLLLWVLAHGNVSSGYQQYEYCPVTVSWHLVLVTFKFVPKTTVSNMVSTIIIHRIAGHDGFLIRAVAPLLHLNFLLPCVLSARLSWLRYPGFLLEIQHQYTCMRKGTLRRRYLIPYFEEVNNGTIPTTWGPPSKNASMGLSLKASLCSHAPDVYQVYLV